MDRRSFVRLLAAMPLVAPRELPSALPRYRIVTPYSPSGASGMPGPYPGRVVATHSDRVVDTTTNKADAAVTTDVPEPPFGDQKQTSTSDSPFRARARATTESGKAGEAAAHDTCASAQGQGTSSPVA